MRHARAITTLIGADRDAMSPRLKGKLDAHLAACGECSGEAEQHGRFQSLIAQAAGLPPEFDEAMEKVRRKTLQAVRVSASKPRVFGSLGGWLGELPRMRPVTATLGLAALVVLAVLIQPMRREGANAPLLTESAPIVSHFRVVRSGSAVRIEWPQNGRQHRLRQGTDPVAVRSADARIVSGKVWTDHSPAPAPGTVHFYVID